MDERSRKTYPPTLPLAKDRPLLWSYGQFDATWNCLRCMAQQSGKTIDEVAFILGMPQRTKRKNQCKETCLRRQRQRSDGGML